MLHLDVLMLSTDQVTVFTWSVLDLCINVSPDSDEMTFSLEKVILWREQQFEVKNVLMLR